MAPQHVPASTKINPNKVRNIDTDRLRRRSQWLDENKGRIARECDGRKRMRDVAREILEVQRELARRENSKDEDVKQWTSELDSLLDGLDVPQLRRTDIRWLSRNLHINNLGHPDFTRASRLVRKLMDAM